MRPLTGFTARLGGVIALHLVLLAALLTYGPAREAMVKIIPVTINMATPQADRPATRPKNEPRPATKPAEQRPKPAPAPSPILSAQNSPAVAEAPPAPVPATSPASSPSSAAAPAAPIAAAAASPGPLTPPSHPAYLNNPKPVYPKASLDLGEEGRVLLDVQVSASGAVDQVSVRTSSGHARLDQAAVRAVRQWKFIPGRRGGEAVAAPVQVPINFNLEDN
jgi:protein TonB